MYQQLKVHAGANCGIEVDDTAYLSGLAAVMPVLILLLVVGIPVTLPTLLATVFVVAVALAAVGASGGRRAALPEPPPRTPAET